MIKMLNELFGRIAREHPAKKLTPVPNAKRPAGGGDFRAVTIAPSIICCTAAMRATGKTYLLHQAPRLPLASCTMPKNCSCKFRKNADRRDTESHDVLIHQTQD
jgi:hypothetical protein